LHAWPFGTVHIDRQADHDCANVIPLKHLEKRCRIKRKLFAHDDWTRVCEGESLV
jgi:hypothetical protein